MSFNSECLSTDSREEFCLALKAAREGKGITLDEIADTTKIPAFMFAALERCDLSRWPKGFFRRSFFRDYVQMLSLPVSEACAQFARLFPDEEGVVNAASTTAEPNPASAAAALWRRIADGVTRVVGRITESTAEPPREEPQERTWITDARRVGPPPARQFRVRIKLPR
ncbi:MAG: helix-turn-helix transcriptional regulator [Acidobacteriota bacterium]|nr:helix-turn-helix transcriptional regulator [Acidobacteriota bacterium]